MSEMHEFIDEPKLPHQCYHYLDNNHRCEATAMHGEYFCHLHRVKPSPIIYLPAEGFALPDLKDRDAIQLAVSQVADRIAGNQIDNKRAGLLLFAIQIASSNLPPHARASTASPATPSSPVILTLSEVKGKNPRISPVQPLIPAIPTEAANTPTLTSPTTGKEQPATLRTLQATGQQPASRPPTNLHTLRAVSPLRNPNRIADQKQHRRRPNRPILKTRQRRPMHPLLSRARL